MTNEDTTMTTLATNPTTWKTNTGNVNGRAVKTWLAGHPALEDLEYGKPVQWLRLVGERPGDMEPSHAIFLRLLAAIRSAWNGCPSELGVATNAKVQAAKKQILADIRAMLISQDMAWAVDQAGL